MFVHLVNDVLLPFFFKGKSAAYQANLNLLFWSEEETSVAFSDIVGKCFVVYGENLTLVSEQEFFLQGPYRWASYRGL